MLLDMRMIAARVVGVIAAAMAMPLAAAGFSVSPTRIDFAATDSVKGLRLHNHGERPVQAQLRVFAWHQADGDDVLAPSTDLVVSPPMATIAPGAQQMVRLVRRDGAAAVTGERSYRLLVDELPPARMQPAPVVPAGLNFVIRYSVPLFIAAGGAADPGRSLTWFTVTDDDGRPRMAVHNPSATHAQLSALRVVDAQGRTLHRHDGLLGYVLAHATRSWPLDLPAQALADAAAIEVAIDGEHRRLPRSRDAAPHRAR